MTIAWAILALVIVLNVLLAVHFVDHTFPLLSYRLRRFLYHRVGWGL